MINVQTVIKSELLRKKGVKLLDFACQTIGTSELAHLD